MAWFGDGLSSLSNLKGQITSFTKEVLSESVVSDTDEQAKLLEEANIKCVQLQDLLNSRDAEISVLRRQNCELQNAVVESNVRGLNIVYGVRGEQPWGTRPSPYTRPTKLQVCGISNGNGIWCGIMCPTACGQTLGAVAFIA
ncbi:hypothetical protein KQX54_006829 [Cotesia glomerata]|uniref:Uncharacterized protein n=1 Tax=Cotesia glomerata TaxID=32391 RepID=A0AAV7I7L5_COTGL|nr:hypothetical protein KQX54_006829 [Cotesia glomerata]